MKRGDEPREGLPKGNGREVGICAGAARHFCNDDRVAEV